MSFIARLLGYSQETNAQPPLAIHNTVEADPDSFFFVGHEIYIEELQPKFDSFKTLFVPDEGLTQDEHWFYFPKIGYHHNMLELRALNWKIEQQKSDLQLLVEGLEKGSCSKWCDDYIKGRELHTYGPGQKRGRTDSFGMSYFIDMSFSALVHEAVASEYTIHFTPKPEYTLAVIDLLLKALQADRTLQSHVFSFKVARLTESKPTIVISTTPNICSSNRFYTSVNYALSALFTYFKPYLHFGLGVTPPFSFGGTNGLISYAQGSISHKIALEREKPEIFKKLYDETGVHYHPDLAFNYSFSPVLPEGF